MFDNAAKSLWFGDTIRRSLLDPKPTKRPDEEEGGAVPSPKTRQAMEAFFAAQDAGETEELPRRLSEVVQSWRADNAAGGVPVHGHLPLPSQFAEAVASELSVLPQPVQNRELKALLAPSDDGVRVVVDHQVRDLLRNGDIARRHPVVRGESDSPKPLDHWTSRELMPSSRSAIEDENELHPRRNDRPHQQDTDVGKLELETLEYNPARDRLSPKQVYFDPNPYNAIADLSPEDQKKFLHGAARTAEATVNFLGSAIYELSPLSDAADFLGAVRKGDYALAALTVLMAMPPLKGVRIGHHIVAQAAFRHDEVRGILRAFGVKIDDPDNLARMMKDAHQVLHTKRYYDYVTSRIRSANGADEIRSALRDIRSLLERFESRSDSRKYFPPLRPPRQ